MARTIFMLHLATLGRFIAGMLSLLLLLDADPGLAQNRPDLATMPYDSTFGARFNSDFRHGSNRHFLIDDYWGSIDHPDGGFYVVGSTREGSATDLAALGRFTEAGRIDSSFGNTGAGVQTLDPLGTDARLELIKLMPNGDLLVAGEVDDTGSQDDVAVLARYTADGSLVTTFGDSGMYVSDAISGLDLNGLTVLEDGRSILNVDGSAWWFSAGGERDSVTGPAAWNAFLPLQEQFSPMSPFFPHDDGYLFVSSSGANTMAIVRLNSDMSRDTNFGNGGFYQLENSQAGPIGQGRSPGVVFPETPDGGFYVYGTLENELMVARFTDAGQPDAAFGTDGFAMYDAPGATDIEQAHAIVILPDGRIMAGGRTQYDTDTAVLLMVLFSADGQVETSFGTDGAVGEDRFGYHNQGRFSWIGGMHLQSDGTLVVTTRTAGNSHTWQRTGEPGIARYRTDIAAQVTDAEYMEPSEIANGFTFDAAWPNPSRGDVTFRVHIEKPGAAHLAVYDVLGRRVAQLVDHIVPAGTLERSWNAAGLPSGLYFARFRMNDRVQSRSVLLSR